MDSVDDGRDFNKARGFLLTYSALVLALWYFGADLTQFKLMGNEIRLHQRIESAWLVLAGLNVYFWFRFYQRLPTNGLCFDSEMQNLYNNTLQWFGMWRGEKDIKEEISAFLKSRGLSSADYQLTNYRAQGVIPPASMIALTAEKKNALTSLFTLARYRVGVQLFSEYSFRSKGKWVQSTIPFEIVHPIGPHLTWPIKAITIFRGAFITPWFTDYVAPLLLGVISTGVAIWKWCDMNFFTKVVAHYPLICAGVTP